MNLLDRIFGKRKAATAAALVREPVHGFSRFSGDAYSSDVYRGAVDAIARNAAKLKGQHVITGQDGKRRQADGRLDRLLQVRPNPVMSSYDMVYKTVSRLYLYNNAFIYIDRDDSGKVRGFYPVTSANVSIATDPSGALFCVFIMKDGREVTLRYEDVVHLRRHYCEGEVLGEDNGPILPGLEAAQTLNEGIINGLKSGAGVRGILRYTSILNDEQLKEKSNAFVADYLDMAQGSGVVTLDNKMEYTPIDQKPVLLDADQEQEVKKKIYSYLGISEPIVSSSYTEDEYSAFYESVLEPLAVAMSQEFTAKAFTDREQRFGNQIVFDAGRMNYTSNKTKVELISQIAPYGMLTINQALEILNLPAVPDGDKRLQALNIIDQAAATQYQLGKRPDNRLKEEEASEGTESGGDQGGGGSQ